MSLYGKICFLPLRLFSDISEDASVHIEDVSIYKVRSLGREEYRRSFEVLHRAPSRCRRFCDDELVERMAGTVSLSKSCYSRNCSVPHRYAQKSIPNRLCR